MAISLKTVNCVHGFRSVDCPHCLAEWADWMEWQREVDEAAELARHATPATEREWEEHLAVCGGVWETWTEVAS